MTLHPPPLSYPHLKYHSPSECKSSLPQTSLSIFSLSFLEKISMKKINLMLSKCKSLSRQLGRSSSYSSLRSKSTRDHEISWGDHRQEGNDNCETIFVGSTRKRYVIDSKYLNHPLLNALTEKSKQKQGELILVKCEVVLFDHLLWMLENADPNHISESLEELADLYAL